MVADTVGMLVWMTDVHSTCIHLNERARAHFGSPSELDLRAWTVFIHPQDRERAREALRHARVTRSEYAVQYRLERSDGTVCWMQHSGAPWHNADGEFAGYMGAIVEVAQLPEVAQRILEQTEEFRRLATRQPDDASAREVSLKSHKQLARALENIGEAFFSVDRNWRLTHLNKRCSDFVGTKKGEGVGHILWDAVPSVLGTTRLVRYSRAMSTGEPEHFEDFHQQRGVWLDVRAYPHEDGLSVFFHDISDRHEAQEALKKSEKRFRDVLEMTPEGYVLADEHMTILDVNPSLCRILQISEEAVAGRPLHDLFEAGRWQTFHKRLAADGNISSFEAKLALNSGPSVYTLINASLGQNPDGTRGLLTAFVTDITERKESEARLQRLATRDPLTNLPNRLYLNERLKELIAESQDSNVALAVMFIDLDRFKEVNDSLGHDAGDMLLKEVAVRLRNCLRPNDLVARLGGDEFVVVVRTSTGRTAAAVVAEKIVQSLAASVALDGHEAFIGASIGISMLGEDGVTPESLFQNADTAMYKAKAGGRNGYRFFCAEMNQEARTRLTLETALRHAIERNELSLHYQPRVELSTMHITGMEALLRWNHPQLGTIPPLDFIPLAEETGLITTIGEWALEEACRQNKLWVQAFGRPLRVSVNLSARQLKSPHLAARFKAILKSTGLPANLLELELTETALMEDPAAAAKTLKELKSMGIALSIDDFGTGHSSLAYLRQFPIDSVKLDRAFLLDTVADVNPLKLAESIINLVHTLNLSVVAEGVESQEILDFLLAAQCDEVQGFFLAKPLPAEEFEAFVHRYAWEYQFNTKK